MRSLIANNTFMIVLAICLMLVGAYVGYTHKDFMWFARFGALVVAVGLALLSRSSVIGIDVKMHVTMAETGLSHLDPDHYRKLGEPVPAYVSEDQKMRFAVGVLGPIISLLGTVVWGFGDLLNKCFGFQT